MIPKFRAWDKVNKKLKQVYSIDFDENGEIQSIKDEYTKPNEMYAMFEIEYFELMQSTGLKDINGTEIYEGDIIDKGYLSKVHDEIGVVKFDKGVDSDGFHAEVWLGWITDKNSSLLDVYKKCKVLGNIYENPELLEDN